MSLDLSTLFIILGCALVTFIPRVVPFAIVRNMTLPEPVLKWLSYIPVCILTALVVENFTVQTENALQVNWEVIIVIIPTIFIAIRSKSLSVTVLSGVALMAAVRFIMG